MTVSTSTNRWKYDGNGATTAFPYTGKIFAATDLVVHLIDADGNATLQTLNTDYTVSGVGATAGGNVTFTTAPAVGETVLIRRVLALVQSTSVKNQGAFYPEIHEDAFDRLVMIDQQQQDEINRTFRTNPLDPDDGELGYLPAKSDRADKFLVFDANGDPTTTVLNTDTILNAASETAENAAVALASANAASESAVVAQAAANAATPTVVNFTGDGSTTDFELPYAVEKNSTNVFVSGQYQGKGAYAIVSGTTLRFLFPPANGVNIEVNLAATSAMVSGDTSAINYNQGGAGSVTRGLAAKLRDMMPNAKDFGAEGDGVTDDTAAWQSYATNIDPHLQSFPSRITDRVDLSGGYTTLIGRGDGSPINIEGPESGFYFYTESGATFDDHPHRLVRDCRFVGDGTNTLYEHARGSYSSHHFNVYEGGDVGLSVSSFVNDGYKNHYRGNKVGLHLNGVTAHLETQPYARYHNDPNGAAILIDGASTENVTILGGAIEGNRAPAIKVGTSVDDGFRLTLHDVYFELDGDYDAGVPSIDIPSSPGNSAVVVFNGGKLSRNVLTDHPDGRWESGEYRLGKNAVFKDGTKLNGDIFVENASFSGCVYLTGARFNRYEEPMLVHECRHLIWQGGRDTITGFVFAVPVTGKPSGNNPQPNLGPTAHPYAFASSTDSPVVSENSDDDYGDGSWTRVQFQEVAGTLTTGFARIGGSTDVTGFPWRVDAFLMKSDTTAVFGIGEVSGGGVNYIRLEAGKTYKIIMLSNRAVSGNRSVRIFPDDASGPTLDVICLYQAMFDDQFQASAFLSWIANT